MQLLQSAKVTGQLHANHDGDHKAANLLDGRVLRLPGLWSNGRDDVPILGR